MECGSGEGRIAQAQGVCVMAKKKTERLFNNRERKLFRKHIPTAESVFGGFFIAVLLLATWWFIAQKDNFDPTERDISMELMIDGSVEDTLYRTPLQRWMDPAQVHAYAGAPGAMLMDTGFFPQDILAGHWDVGSRAETFDAGRMWEKINGAAEQYLQFGCKNLHYISLKKQDEELELNIEMYDMGAFQNALGIFSIQRDEYTEVSTDGPIQFYDTTAGAIGITGPFYIKVAGDQASEELVRKAKQIIKAVAEMDEAKSGLPKALQVFSDVLDIPFAQISFEKSDVFQYGFANNFWFAQPDSEKDLKYFVHEGESEEDIKKLYDLLVENFLYDYEEVSKTDNEIVMKHLFLEVYLVISMNGNTLYGVDGVEEFETLDSHLAVLKGAFLNEAG